MSISEFLRFLPFLSANNPPDPLPQRSRRELLKIMETEVNVRLDDSLYYQELIQLHGDNLWKRVGQPEQVMVQSNPVIVKPELQPERTLLTFENAKGDQSSTASSLEIFDGSKTQLDPSEKIIEVCDRDDIAGRLLILGAPGSGKTTTLLELARDLIQRAQQQSTHPIPVLFEFSDWKNDKQTFVNWLATNLFFRHNIPKAITRKLLKRGQLLPLLDGLNDLGLTRQQLCIQKINEFLQVSSNQSSLVVCCCQEDYIKGQIFLETLRGVIYLQPLSTQNIEDYLKQVGCWHLCSPLKDDREGLLELAKKPLLLKLIPIVYPTGLKPIGRYFSDPNKRREYQQRCDQELWNAYINHCIGKFHKRQRYKPKDVKKWLIWLASTLKEQNKTEFLIENLQPYLLVSLKKKRLYQLICGIIGCFIGGVIGYLLDGLEIGFLLGLILGLTYALKSQTNFAEASIIFLKNELDALLFGLSFSLTLGLISWVFFGLTIWIVSYLNFWLVFGLLSGISMMLMVGIDEGSEVKSRNKPNQGIRESAQNAVITSFISLPAGMLLYALLRIATGLTVEPFKVLTSGLGLALLIGIGYSGLACIQHFVLRLILWSSGAIPWNYAHFLTYAVERRFIKQVGGRYRFIHNALRDRLAQMLDSE